MASSRKPPPANLSSPLNRRSMPPPVASSSAAGSARGSSRSPTPTGAAPAPARRNTIRDGASLTHRNSISSPLSARSAAKRSSEILSESDLESAVIMEDLRSRLSQSESAAEAAAEEYAKQVKALQIRLEEALVDQIKMEEGSHQKDEVIEGIELQVKELTRAKRDQENIYEAERIAAQQEKEEMLDREEELNIIIQRLKDQLAQREKSPEPEVAESRSRTSLESSADEPQGFAPSNNVATPNRNNNLLLQKDKLIESLRLELAEAQIRLAEADHQGGAKLNHLEQQLLEARMANARLMEDNESFQLLLSSAALNGDFPRGDYITNAFSEVEPEPESHVVKKVQGSPRNSISLGPNLAEELEEAAQTLESEKYRKLESEFKSLKDQNKAMSLYINNIIERILQHKDSEAILDKTAPLGASAAIPRTDKALPAPPKEEGGLLSRTKSLATRKKDTKSPTPSVNGDKPALQRSQSMRSPNPPSHKRSHSDAVYTGASVVNNLYRGEGMITPRAQSFFGPDQFNRGQRPRDSDLSLDSTTSESGDSVSAAPTPAPIERRSMPSPPHHSSTTTIGPIAGNKLRPLRLVQENVGTALVSPPLGGGSRKISGDYKEGVEDEKSRKQNKRTSWLPWLNRNKDDEGLNSSVNPENVLFERRDVE